MTSPLGYCHFTYCGIHMQL